MFSLLIANIPHDCDHDEIQAWIETQGFRITKLRLISDLVTGTSPAFARVQLHDAKDTDRAARTLDGCSIRKHTLRVKALKTIEPAAPLRYKVSA